MTRSIYIYLNLNQMYFTVIPLIEIKLRIAHTDAASSNKTEYFIRMINMYNVKLSLIFLCIFYLKIVLI